MSAKELSSIVIALEHGTLLEWYLRPSEMNGGELVRAARTVLLRGILNEPEPSVDLADLVAPEKKKITAKSSI